MTEEAFGVDLVALQLRVAAGEPLPASLPSAPSARAIEARVYAEDAEHGFLPQTGRLLVYRGAVGAGDPRRLRRFQAGTRSASTTTRCSRRSSPAARRARRPAAASRPPSRRRSSSASRRTSRTSAASSTSEPVVKGEIDTSLLERLEIAPVPPPSDEVFEAARREFSSKGPEATGEGSRFPDPFAAEGFRMFR